MTKNQIADVVIIGSGIAALVAATRLCEHKNVIVITKSKKENSNSNMAQGGVAAAVSRDDNWMNHFVDTITAGNDHNINNAVEILVKKGPKYLQDMMVKGMIFDSDDNGRMILGQEGAHGKRRILHAGGDATGKALVEFMLGQLNDKVKIVEDILAVDLLVDSNKCYGIKIKRKNGKIENLYCKHTIIASGGCGGLYSFSSNDSTITGDGVAMAYRAGANLVDLEFVQFHPTMLYTNGKANGLVSEAVRGEGAILITESGKPLMKGVHPLADLAPRDVVSREIHRAFLQGETVYLDVSMIENFSRRFPTISKICEENGVDWRKGKLPIVPGAHFHMGGIQTNESGQTSIQHLYAIGEVACTGVHGANRLASNSLLEGIVFANSLADFILTIPEESWDHMPESFISSRNTQTMQLPTKAEVQQIMMTYVGIVRTEEGLTFAQTWFEKYVSSFSNLVPEGLSHEDIIIYNMLQTGWLITSSALMRTESRGGHYRTDYPAEIIDWKKKRIVRNSRIPALHH
ncbi:L-aspartate oxidase [Bacillus sp. Marseille-P3661]|uniref:L-aspartate oxidase n=1 Tax=Bacillus sp. Marseille-P3661 TaxID=1936234 RepID=UPI000C835BE2|nr:L-aspartate oxidase [Bacillus sp. Marseille-P3661]